MDLIILNDGLYQLIPVTKKMLEGIELLKVFSRYRFLVGVGKMFEFSDVRKTIEDTLTNKD